MPVAPPLYMAIKFAPDAVGWADTGARLSDPGLPAGGEGQPPNRNCWSATRAVGFKCNRDYEGTGSTVGPNLASRTTFGDVSVERSRDALSPLLFDYCISSKVIEEVHFVYLPQPAGPVLLHIVIKGVNVSKFEETGSRFMGQQVSQGTPVVRHAYVAGASNLDKIDLYYTQIAMGFEGMNRGWDFGTETKWAEATWAPSPTPNPSP